MQEQLLHIRFWFLVPEYQLAALDSKTLLNLFEPLGVATHPSPDPALAGYALLSMRLRPPSALDWRQHHLTVFGVTAGLDDLPPYQDLVNAAITQRGTERRATVRASGVTEEEAMALCHKQELWGYRLALAEFSRRGQSNILMWSVWYEEKTLQGVIRRHAGTRSRPYFEWCGASGIWPFRDMTFVQLASPGVLIEKP